MKIVGELWRPKRRKSDELCKGCKVTVSSEIQPNRNTPVKAGSTSAEATSWPNPRRAWFGVVVLMACYATAFVDRQIITLLVEPIKQDLRINDTEFSLLSGLAFTLFYTVMGIPLAWAADRWSRQKLIMLGVAVWSAMTAACGMANSFFTLFLARIGVGIGEAGLSPAAYSMIADSFPPARRARAMGVYSIGAIAGVGLALMIGGAVVQWAVSSPPMTLPVIGTLKSWQLAFLIVSLPGPLLIFALALVREPTRKDAAPDIDSPSQALLPFLRKQWAVLSLLTAGYSLLGVALAAYLVWTPAFLIRAHGWEIGQVGIVFGSILLICCSGGVLLGGWATDHLAKAGHKDGILRVAMFGGALCYPFAVAVPFAENSAMAVILLTLACSAFGLFQGLPAATFLSVTPNRLRARVLALYFLIGNLVAFTIGPTVAALISDHWLKDPTKIGVAVGILCAVAIPLGVAALAAARRPFILLVGAAESVEN